MIFDKTRIIQNIRFTCADLSLMLTDAGKGGLHSIHKDCYESMKELDCDEVTFAYHMNIEAIFSLLLYIRKHDVSEKFLTTDYEYNQLKEKVKEFFDNLNNEEYYSRILDKDMREKY